MKPHYIIFWLFPIVSFNLSSCKKVADVEPPEFRQKLVINAFLSPDKTKNVIFISSNHRRFGEINGQPEPYGNISLYLFENSKEIQLDAIQEIDNPAFPNEKPLFLGYNFIVNNFRFKEGQTYNLKVRSDIGLEAEATCKIPFQRDFRITVDTTFRKTTDEYGQKISILIAKISITDYPGEANYYRLLYLYETYHPAFPNKKQLSYRDALETFEPVVPSSAESMAWQNDRVKNDIGLDGKNFIIRAIEFQPIYIDHPSWNDPDSAFLKIYLLSTDKPYYDFHKSLENFSLGDSPFTEPSFLYSNVKGGLGIFASYTLDSLIFRVK